MSIGQRKKMVQLTVVYGKTMRQWTALQHQGYKHLPSSDTSLLIIS